METLSKCKQPNLYLPCLLVKLWFIFQIQLILYLLHALLFSSVHSDLGVHVDGFISNVAHSFVVGVTKVCYTCTVADSYSYFVISNPVIFNLSSCVTSGQPTDRKEG